MAKLTVKRPKQKFRGYREYIGDIPLEMVLIPDGTFTMGAPETEEGSRSSERPQHNVALSSFLMGRYPVTQAQWKAIASRSDLKINIDLAPDPSRFKEDFNGIERWQRPVEQVSWFEAVEFCQRLSKLTVRSYTLPSEAQWEYACRGITKPLNLEAEESYPPFHFGETITTDLANYQGTDNDQFKQSGSYGREPKGEYREQTTPVGYFKAVNAFGLSDMHGNVWEWCLDDWHDNYEGAPTDGSAWFDDNKSLAEKDSPSVLRGGSWDGLPNICRSAFRGDDLWRDIRLISLGFRVVCVAGRTL